MDGSVDKALFAELLGDRGPLVLALHEVVPKRSSFLPGDQLPERGDVQDDPVVEVGNEVEVGGAAELVLEVAEFGEERLPALKLLVELLGPLGLGAQGGLLGAQLPGP